MTWERELRLHRQRIEQELSVSAERWQIKCSFSHLRDETGLALFEQLHTDTPALCRQQPVAAVEASLPPQAILHPSIWLPGSPLRGEEVVAIATRHDAEAVLDAVKPLVRRGRRPVVIILAEQPEQARQLEQRVRALLAAEGIDPRIEPWHSGDFDELCQRLRSRAIRFLLLSNRNDKGAATADGAAAAGCCGAGDGGGGRLSPQCKRPTRRGWPLRSLRLPQVSILTGSRLLMLSLIRPRLSTSSTLTCTSSPTFR